MRLFYEIVMGVAFLLPLPAMLLRMLRDDMDAQSIEEYRFFSAACAIGFLLGAVAIFTIHIRRRNPHERR